MLIGIDHVVLAVADPDAAAAALEESLGLGASAGGRHEALGTFNRIVWLGDSYLELIGVFDASLAATGWLGRPVLRSLDAGGGLAAWAVAVDDLSGHLAWTGADSRLAGPAEGERRRPDGRLVRWKVAHPPEIGADAPFLIEHDASAAEWTLDERRERAAERHPMGGRVRLASIDFEMPSPPASAGRLRTALGATAEPDGRRAVLVRIGSQSVRFAAQGGPEPRAPILELVADVPVRRRTTRVGDCQVRLRGTTRPES
jgi:hypothetical protein